MLTFRLAHRSAADAEAFCALSNSLYARKVTPAYYDWQFFQCPHAPFLMTGWRDGNLVAAYGVHVVQAHDAPRAMSLDIMVAASEQGKGLIAPLAEMAMEEARSRGARAESVVANQRARAAMEKRLGWGCWETISDWTSANPFGGPFPVRVAERPDCDFKLDEPTFYPRTAATLAWRTSSPRYAYQWLRIGAEAVEGWAAVKSFVDPSTAEGFGDLLGIFPTSSEAVLSDLIASTQAWFAARSIATTAFTPATSAETEAARALRFSPSSRYRHFCGRGTRPHVGIGMLDIDVY
jgi:GNAT superfamily N-acetyltransferase